MKNTIYLLLTIAFIVSNTAIAQNLVPNPSFEEYTTPPSKNDDFSTLKYWTTPSKTNQPDFLHASGSGVARIPYTGRGEVKPRGNGKGVAGLIIYKRAKENYREYISVKLKQPMEVGEKYVVSFYITNGIRNQYGKFGANALGVCFTETALEQDGTKPIRAKPQYVMGKVLYRDYWRQVNFVFKADKPYQHLTLGNFWFDGNIVKKAEEDATGQPLCYYFIDEVEVMKERKTPPKNVDPVVAKAETLKEKDVKALNSGGVIKLNIFYKTNGYTLEDATQPSLGEITDRLDNIVHFLKRHPFLSIEVGGHTNGRCAEEFCKELSRKRAKEIADYLITRKVDKNQVRFKGYGKEFPVASDNTKMGRRQNQRVEIKVIKN